MSGFAAPRHMGSPVIHFEIHASDRPAVAAFYETVFGWKTLSAPGMPYTLLWPTGEDLQPGQPPATGIGGGMLDRQGGPPEDGAPVNGFVCILQVEDVEATKDAVLAHGGQTALEPMDVEGVGRVYYFKDPDGNVAGALQPAG